MVIYISIKQAGKRKNFITRQELVLESTPATLRELIRLIVERTVADYNAKTVDASILNYLSPEKIQVQAQTGKVGFNDRKHEQQADLAEAIATAILAFEDGLYRVFNGDAELTSLDQPISLEEGDLLTFIRFTMLAGRMW